MTQLPQVGEWWIDSDGDVGQVVFISPHANPLYLVVYRSMSTDNPPDFFECWQAATDLDKHIPECTGWDWKPEVWRTATAHDLAGKQPKRCRFKRRTDHIHWEYGNLVGMVPFTLGRMASTFGRECYVVQEDSMVAGWDWAYECEVLDDGY